MVTVAKEIKPVREKVKKVLKKEERGKVSSRKTFEDSMISEL